MFESLPFEWFLLLLRILFIVLLYFFLYQVVRVTIRELTTIAAATSGGEAVAQPRALGRLVVVDGAESDLRPGTAFPLQPVTTVGRRPDSTMPINEPFVSAEHAELAYDNGRWWLRDLGSTNGTFLNGIPVTVSTGIRPGDVVQFGRIKLQFVP